MLEKIQLINFRNFCSEILSFSPGVNVIIGPNASGKTNVLEAVFLLATGRSFKARVEEEMINYYSDLSRVRGRTESDLLEVVLTRGEVRVGDAKLKRLPRKRLLINNSVKRLVDFAGFLPLVVFAPWDLDLVTASPSGRRDYLDMVLSQIDREYRRALASYEKGLRQRNKLLFRIREEGLPRNQLLFWNQLLIKNGDYIANKRSEFIDFVNRSLEFDGQSFRLEYDKSAISESRLLQYRDEEIAAATTLVGPHRDDFIFWMGESRGKRKLDRFGSRGEQRMGVLWLKLAELAYIEKEIGRKPTLLLDDIFSELDHQHRGMVVKLSQNQQTVITTADPHFVENFSGVGKIDLGG